MPYGVYPSLRTYGVYPFPLFSQENGIHHSFCCSVTWGPGDRPRKEGVPQWWCILQRKRDDNKHKICVFQRGGVGGGAERKIVQNAIFRGKRHDNKILKVNILLSRNFLLSRRRLLILF